VGTLGVSPIGSGGRMHELATKSPVQLVREPLRHALTAWDGLLESLPIAVYVCDTNGLIIQYNRKAAELWGRAPAPGDTDERFCGSYRMFFVDGRLLPHAEGPMADVLSTGRSVRNAEVQIERPDGSRVAALVNIDPLLDAAGLVVGAVNCFQDVTELRYAHDELRRSQGEREEQVQRLAITYEHANVAISEIDAEGRRLRVNETACQVTGLTREELIGGVVFDSGLPADAEVDRPQFQRLVAGEIDQYSIEKRFIKKDGTTIWIAATCSAVRDRDKKFLYAVRVFDDVTESKQMADALAESEQRLAATYEQATIGISEVDEDGRFLRVNEASCRIAGFSRDELLGRASLFDRMDDDEARKERHLYQRQVKGEIDRYSIEKRIRRKDGKEVWVSVMSSSVRDRNGRFRYAVRVLQDVSERKESEERLRTSERRLRALLEGLPAAVYMTDAQGRVTFFNQAAVEFSGRTPTLGSDEWCVSWKLYWPDGTPLPHDECPMAVALKEARPIRDAEAVAERPDGTRVPFIPYPTPLFDSDGKLIGGINMLVDISERKKAERHQKTLIDELNHRVKNTLATVQSLARQTARGASAVKEFETRLEGRLIALSQAHDQLTRGNWQQADLREIVEGALSAHGEEMSDQVAIDDTPIDLNPRAALTLAMVFHELTTNAVKYGSLSQPSGRLHVTWRMEEGKTGRTLRLHWRESGGPRVEPPSRRGFGSRMVERSIPAELGGTAALRFEPAGVICELEFPLAEVREQESAEPERSSRIRRRG
jgi:PAS domain S-box-containing protein